MKSQEGSSHALTDAKESAITRGACFQRATAREQSTRMPSGPAARSPTIMRRCERERLTLRRHWRAANLPGGIPVEREKSRMKWGSAAYPSSAADRAHLPSHKVSAVRDIHPGVASGWFR